MGAGIANLKKSPQKHTFWAMCRVITWTKPQGFVITALIAAFYDMNKHQRIHCKKLGILAFSSLGCISAGHAQDIVRPSMTHTLAPENRTFATEEPKYNILAGPVSMLFDASLFVEYNDNVNLSEVNKQDDIIIRPQIGVTASWQLTEVNTLTLKLGAGYAYYTNGTLESGSNFTLDPGSEIALNLYVGDFRIRFYDSFSLQDSPVDSPGFSNVENFGQFQNTAGVAVSWAISNLTATLGYSHGNTTSITSTYSYLDSVTDQIYGSLYYAINPTWGVGIEGAFGVTSYDENIQNDADSWHAGVFVEGTLTENFSFRAAVGQQEINFDSSASAASVPGVVGSLGADTQSFSGIYANLGFTHHVNEALTHELTVGREGLLGINSNFIDLFYVRHTAQWTVIKDVDLVTRFFYEKSEESGPFNAEDADRYGFSIGANYQLTQSWILSGEYGYIHKESNLPLRNYEQNRLILGLTYSF